jgi:hypothetical protein
MGDGKENVPGRNHNINRFYIFPVPQHTFKIPSQTTTMAETARPKKETAEYFDEPAVLAEKIARLAEWVRASKHFIAFTGAGLSHS